MSRRTASEQTPAAALRSTAAAVDRVTELARNVLRKYPRETITDALKPLNSHRQWSFRPSLDGLEVVLTARLFDISVVRMPIELLEVQDSEVTDWVRTQYWLGRESVKARQRREAAHRVKVAREALNSAQAVLKRAEQSLEEARDKAEELTAPTMKQRREWQRRREQRQAAKAETQSQPTGE